MWLATKSLATGLVPIFTWIVDVTTMFCSSSKPNRLGDW